MDTRLRIGAYLLLGLVLFYGFLVWHFPYDPLKRAIIQGFEENLPLRLSIATLGPSFPYRIRLENVRVHSGSLFFRIPDLTVTPGVVDFFLGKSAFQVGDSGNPSRLRAEFRQEERQGRMALSLNNLEIRASSPQEFSALLKLSGEASLQWPGEDWEKGSGEAWALLEKVGVEGAQSSQIPFVLALFHALRVEVQLREGMVRMKRLEISGKDLKASLPKEVQFPLKGGSLPPDLGLIFQRPKME